MITPKQFFKEKPDLPKWLTSHKLFKEIGIIHKVFPGIGLPNITEDFILNNDEVILDAGKKLVDALTDLFIKRKIALEKFQAKGAKIGAERKQSLNDLLIILDNLSSQTKDNILIRSNTGKITLNLPSDIVIGDKSIFKKGEGLFKIYGKVNKVLIENKFKALKEPDSLPAFKQFSSANIPTKKSFKIVFSSTGPDGLWDIATMSMRGVASCQSWDGDYRRCLIGSILDPFVGIIYIASNENTKYGSKMTRRCVVRFTVNEKTRIPAIIIDRMYPSVDKSVIDVFVQFIRHKTKNKYDVIYVDNDHYDHDKIQDLYMPLTELRKKIGNLDLNKIKKDGSDNDQYIEYEDDLEVAREAQYTSTASYQDTFIPSKISETKDSHTLLFEKNSSKKIEKFQSNFKKAFQKSLEDAELKQFSGPTQSAIRKLSGITKDIQIHPNNVVKHIVNLITKDVISSVNKEYFATSDAYIRRVYYTYLVRKKEIFETVKTKLTPEINGKLRLKNKLKSKQVVDMLNILSSKIDMQLKEKLKELVEKRKQRFSGAASQVS